MTLEEIKQAVLSGKSVHWVHEGYVVKVDRIGQWDIACAHNKHAIGLTHADGVTLNGEPHQFYVNPDADLVAYVVPNFD